MKKKFDKKKAKKNLVTKKRSCRFCADHENVIDYKRTKMLSDFLSERCKITARRVNGNCQFHQTRVVESIKRARQLALLPFTVQHLIRL